MPERLFDIRPGEPEDHAFIYATWLRSYRDSNAARSLVDDPRFYYEYHHAIIEAILSRGSVTVAVAIGDPKTILGYAVHEPRTLHYVYVKHGFRRMGIAKALLSFPIETYTHRSKMAAVLTVPRTWHYNGYRL
jgi:GNAT superfamily N-acetyltransferase